MKLTKIFPSALAISWIGMGAFAQQPSLDNYYPQTIPDANNPARLIRIADPAETYPETTESTATTQVFTQEDVEKIVSDVLKKKAAEDAKAKEEKEKAEKDKAAAEKVKVQQAAAEDKAVKNFQANMKKAGKPIPKPTPIIVAAAPAAPAAPAAIGTAIAPVKAAAKPAEAPAKK